MAELDGADFYDPVKGRRINWGWAKVAYGPWNDKDSWASSAHTLPRCACQLCQLAVSACDATVACFSRCMVDSGLLLSYCSRHSSREVVLAALHVPGLV